MAALPLLAVVACRAPSAPSVVPAAPEPTRSVSEPAAAESSEVPRVIGADEDDAERWLKVIEVRKGSPGGWATGSFDAERNRIAVRSRDVRRFTIDTGRIPIDWDRLVVLSIDGRTSELRKRDFPVLHFNLDEQGEWVIAEP